MSWTAKNGHNKQYYIERAKKLRAERGLAFVSLVGNNFTFVRFGSLADLRLWRRKP